MRTEIVAKYLTNH